MNKALRHCFILVVYALSLQSSALAADPPQRSANGSPEHLNRIMAVVNTSRGYALMSGVVLYKISTNQDRVATFSLAVTKPRSRVRDLPSPYSREPLDAAAVQDMCRNEGVLAFTKEGFSVKYEFWQAGELRMIRSVKATPAQCQGTAWVASTQTTAPTAPTKTAQRATPQPLGPGYMRIERTSPRNQEQ